MKKKLEGLTKAINEPRSVTLAQQRIENLKEQEVLRGLHARKQEEQPE